MNFTKIFKTFNSYLYSLNDSKFFAGLVFIMLNIGSKYITLKFSKSQEAYLRLVLSRQLLIFSIAWMGTRDIYTAFIILALFNEESSFCILPESYKKLYKLMDVNDDGILTEDEINQSIKILEKAKKLKTKELSNQAYSKFHNLKNKDY